MCRACRWHLSTIHTYINFWRGLDSSHLRHCSILHACKTMFKRKHSTSEVVFKPNGIQRNHSSCFCVNIVARRKNEKKKLKLEPNAKTMRKYIFTVCVCMWIIWTLPHVIVDDNVFVARYNLLSLPNFRVVVVNTISLARSPEPPFVQQVLVRMSPEIEIWKMAIVLDCKKKIANYKIVRVLEMEP